MVLGLVVLACCVGLVSCDLLKPKPPDPDVEVHKKLNLLQIALEQNVPDGSTTVVSVVAVLDSAAMVPASKDTKPSADAAAKEEAALRRERDVRQELNNVLVANKLMNVIQPDQVQIDKARQEIIATNSAPLSAALAAEIGTALKAQYLVCALIDDDGKQVSVEAQQAADGKVVFQDTLLNWSICNPLAAEQAPAK
jgi:hypothetical protein